MDASQEIIKRKYYWNFYSKASKFEDNIKFSKGINFSNALKTILNTIREIIQRIYYWKFYLKVQEIGKNIRLSKGGSFIHARNMKFGNNIFISNNFHISANNLVFGSNIMAGPNLVIECSNHKMDIIGESMFKESHNKLEGSIRIEDDVWFGANVTILPNVVISEGCVVGAGSIVTKSLPPYTVCVGIPCKPIKKRFSEKNLEQHLQLIRISKYKIDDIRNQWNLYNI